MSNEEIRVGQYRHLVAKYRKVVPPNLSSKGINQAASVNLRTKDNTAGLAAYTKTLSEREAIHLLSRTSFGPTMRELQETKGKTVNQLLQKIIVEDAKPLSVPVNNYNNFNESVGVDPDVPFGESFVNSAFNNEFEGFRNISLKIWHIDRLVHHQGNIHEKMVMFWWNMLPIQMWELFFSKAAYSYSMMLYRNALGNFKTLIRELTLEPAMLIYLSGAFNSKEAPDENFARELQELFCIGKGPDAKFTEKDVQSAAKVLTGWTLNWPVIRAAGKPFSFFFPQRHDTSDKQFSAFYGNKVIVGKQGADGEKELDELLDMIFDNEETARHLARKLYQYFVTNEISSAAELNVIRPLANIIRDNDYEIKPALHALLSSEHFFHPENIGSQIKSPLDFMIGLWRRLDMPVAKNQSEALKKYVSLHWNTANLGQEIGDPPNVAGWPAYYQAPLFDKSWISTDTITNRGTTTDSMIYWGFWMENGEQIPADILKHLASIPDVADPNKLIKNLFLIHLGLDPDENVASELKKILLAGQDSDYYWTGAWQSYVAKPTDEENIVTVMNRVRPMLQKLFQMGEAHLM